MPVTIVVRRNFFGHSAPAHFFDRAFSLLFR
jgi:hypothetical protein